MTGIIRKVSERGFGFITPDAGGQDVFFHSSALEAGEFNGLQAGERVEVEVDEDNPKGRRAVTVEVLR